MTNSNIYKMKTKFSGILTLLLAFTVQLTFAQTKTVSGTILDDTGLPLPGASVLVKGTSTGTSSDFDGNYSIEANQGATLVFSFVGYVTKEVRVGASNTINLIMEEDAQSLDEVVITTLGINRSEKALGFATQSIKAEELTKTNQSDLSKALQGKVAGVDVKMSSGMPGASSQITIRGARSFTGNNTPLYVIDGMPVASTSSYDTGNSVTGSDVSNRAVDIDPNDIESISVLKGQAASALYGIRASNGVILITTKSGKSGPVGKPIVTINQTTSFETVSRTPDFQTTYAQGFNGRFNPTNSMSWGQKIIDLPNDPTYGGNGNGHEGMYRVPQLERAGLDPWVTPRVYNNWNDYFRVGHTSTTSVNLSQANENGNFSIGISNTTQQGIALNTGMTRWNAKANGNLKLNESFSAGFSTNFSTNNIDKLTGANDGSLAGVLAAPSSYNLKGIPSSEPGSPYTQIYYRSLTFDNPYWIEKNHTFNEGTDRFFGNGFLTYATPLSDDMNLTVKYQLGIDSYTTQFSGMVGKVALVKLTITEQHN
jgi:TonB-linked SusC/RagA family outer membrane protein